MNFVWLLGGFHVRVEPSVYVCSTVLGAVLIVHASRSSNLFSRCLESAPLQFMGARSYAVYLLQVPIILFVWLCIPVHEGLLGQFEHVVISLLILGVLTELFYRIVERRAISLSRQMTRKIDVLATTN